MIFRIIADPFEFVVFPLRDGDARTFGGSNSQGTARPTVRELRKDPWVLESDGDGKTLAGAFVTAKQLAEARADKAMIEATAQHPGSGKEHPDGARRTQYVMNARELIVRSNMQHREDKQQAALDAQADETTFLSGIRSPDTGFTASQRTSTGRRCQCKTGPCACITRRMPPTDTIPLGARKDWPATVYATTAAGNCGAPADHACTARRARALLYNCIFFYTAVARLGPRTKSLF